MPIYEFEICYWPHLGCKDPLGKPNIDDYENPNRYIVAITDAKAIKQDDTGNTTVHIVLFRV